MTKPRKPQRLAAKLKLHGITYGAFAETHGFKPRTVKAAVRGERTTGPTALRIAEIITKL